MMKLCQLTKVYGEALVAVDQLSNVVEGFAVVS
jgi:hypothetical protein